MKPTNEELIKEILDATVADWIYDLGPGDEILHRPYQGSWIVPGAREWRVVRFICVSGKKVWFANPRYAGTKGGQ